MIVLYTKLSTPQVSDRLNSLADQHPLVSDALVTISGSVRNTATLLEVPGGDENRVIPRGRSSRSLTCPLLSLRLWSLTLGLVVENDIQKRTMNLQAAFAIVEEA